MRVDVLDRTADAVNDLHRQHEIQIFLIPIRLGGGFDLDAAAVQQASGRFVTAQRDTGPGQALGQAGHCLGGDGPVDQ